MRRILLLFLFLPFLFSCSPDSGSVGFSVVTWNMGSFFDSRYDGGEYDGWKKSDGWNDERYQERINKTVMYMASNFKEADLIILEEVESRDVLISLLEGGLKKEGYIYYGIASDNKELSVAFISRIKPLDISFLFVPSSRAMLNMEFLVNGERIRVIGVHLRSRLKDENKEIRVEELSFLKEEALCSDIPLIVMGDFNCDPFIHTDEMGSRREAKSVLNLTGDGREAYGGILFSPFFDYAMPTQGGTYFFDGEWERLDNILLNSFFFDGDGIEYEKTTVIKGAGSYDHSGLPLEYDKSTGLGLSDHFALMASFVI